MEAEIIAGTALGGAGVFGIGLKLWQMVSNTKAGTAKTELGTEYDKHLYARLKELEDRERDTNTKMLAQAELIGELRAEINQLKGEVKELENFRAGYNRLKAENSKFRRRLGEVEND